MIDSSSELYESENNFILKKFLSCFKNNWCLVIIGALFFSLSHPGLFCKKGLSLFAFICLVPILFLIKKSKIKLVMLYGFSYGLLSYGLYCFWLYRFSKIVFFVAIVVYGLYLAIVFFLIKIPFCLSDNIRQKKSIHKVLSYFCAGLIWCVYEYLKTLGFLGFSYGILGYTQYRNNLLLQMANFGGVWIISVFCVLINIFIVIFIEQFNKLLKHRKMKFLKSEIKVFLAFCILILVFLIYGINSFRKSKSEAYEKIKIICVQNNTDPWKSGVDVYKGDIEKLKLLTDEALEENPDAEIVVWPETSVVPPIIYNYQTKRDYKRYQLVVDLLEYIDSKECAFVLGNQHSEKNKKTFTDDYNSVLFFENTGDVFPPNPKIYRKIHLVPFTENFPYEKIFPRLYKYLLNGDTHLWTAGKDYAVFNYKNISFSTPVCFEDTFGNLCRNFVKNQNDNGAKLFINVSNDAWSKSESCQNQHLSMAVLRSVENNIPTARSTASGVTCFIDSNGGIVSESKSFSENFICEEVNVPVRKGKTFYTKHGDWFPKMEIILLVFVFVILTTFKVVARKSENGVE